MADLTIGEVGKILQLNLINVDQTVSPYVCTPLDLTNATEVDLIYVIVGPGAQQPAPPFKTVPMIVLNPKTNGIVQYSFVFGDLVAPKNMGKNGLFKYTVEVKSAPNNVLYAALDGQLTIKDDSIL
jgi:hypothetical protein